MEQHVYLCIDLKSFYASVECVERGLDPMTTNLVVADPTRSERTICLAVSPSLKALGVKNRCRVFEIPKDIDYITAPPRMQKYIDYAAEIYGIYLRFLSKDDIHVYSVDEAFLDVTHYLPLYRKTPVEMARLLMDTISEEVGVRATCGIGTNLYLTKIALDITAKHSPEFIGYLDEEIYRETLWNHRPLTDFWRIGRGTAERLRKLGIDTMEGIARCDEDLLYRMFGIDAELLIDHAWGREPVTISDIKAYKSKTNCLTSGQVLMRDYAADEAEIIVREMMDSLCLSMVDRDAVTASVTLYVGYSAAAGVPSSKGTFSVPNPTASDKVLVPAAAELFQKIVQKGVPVRRITLCCNHIVPFEEPYQLNLFPAEDTQAEEKTRELQKTVLSIKKKYGKNAVLKAIDFCEGATARERNMQIGGHKSGEETKK